MDEPPATTNDADKSEDDERYELDRIAWNLPAKRVVLHVPEQTGETPPDSELTPAV